VLTVSGYEEDDPMTHSDEEVITDCYSIISAMEIGDSEMPAWILGDVFLSQYYSIYDRNNN